MVHPIRSQGSTFPSQAGPCCLRGALAGAARQKLTKGRPLSGCIDAPKGGHFDCVCFWASDANKSVMLFGPVRDSGQPEASIDSVCLMGCDKMGTEGQFGCCHLLVPAEKIH